LLSALGAGPGRSACLPACLPACICHLVVSISVFLSPILHFSLAPYTENMVMDNYYALINVRLYEICFSNVLYHNNKIVIIIVSNQRMTADIIYQATEDLV
jgi:hypothetical protein